MSVFLPVQSTKGKLRILEDEKTLEVTVFDYAPVDFFMEIYDFFKDDPQALMWDAKIQYIFSLVEEE